MGRMYDNRKKGTVQTEVFCEIIEDLPIKA